MTSSIQLGSILLEEKIGEGGMAEVWRGREESRDRTVAVKIIRGRQARDRSIHEQFRCEAEAVAQLRHPGIVTIFDYGIVPSNVSRESGGDIPGGTPFLAMEYAEAGELDPTDHIRSWAELGDLLFEVLDALGYAHSRGIVHRDLKPGNILAVDEDDDLRFKLTDFGIAHAIDPYENPAEDGLDTLASGTPHYMPPEQLRGKWREFGPWTDLYALGCVAHLLATGSVPFPGDNLMGISRQHLEEPPPQLDPRFPLPDGFEAWVHQLMNKNPERRFRRAADAAHALAELDPIDELGAGESDVQYRDDTDGALDDASAPTADLDWATEVGLSSTLRDTSEGVPDTADATRSEFPSTGEDSVGSTEPAEGENSDEDSNGDTAELPGGGPVPIEAPLGADDSLSRPPIPIPNAPPRTDPWKSDVPTSTTLFGMREIPLVDREPETNQLWEALKRAAVGEGPRGVLIRGRDGLGKTKLAKWFSQAAHRTGCATILRAEHGNFGGSTTGLGRMLEVFFRAWDLDRQPLYERIRTKLEEIYGRTDEDLEPRYLEDDARALTELIRPRDGTGRPVDSGSQFTFSSPRERYLVIERLVAQLADVRPVVLQFDDIDRSSETLGFVEHLFDASTMDSVPVVVVMSAREDRLDHFPDAERRFETLADLDPVVAPNVDPLDESSHWALIRGVLQLRDQLAKRVRDRTGGDPLFAVQLVTEWVDRGHVQPGADGFEPERPGELVVPETAGAFWDQRLDQFLPILTKSAGDAAEASLYVAAALGEHVETEEWQRACEQYGVGEYEDVVHTLVRFGLAERRQNSWSFAFGPFHAAVARRARELETWTDCHAACAAMLAAGSAEAPERTRRRGLHLLAAEHYERALDPLLESADRARSLGQYDEAKYLLERRREALDDLEIERSDPRRLENDVLTGELHKVAGRSDRARSVVDSALDRARDSDWDVGYGKLLTLEASLLTDEGAFREAYEATREAAHYLLQNSEDAPRALAETLRKRGGILYQLGELDEAVECFRKAAGLFDRSNDLSSRAECKNFEATAFIAAGELDRAERAAEDALQTARLFRNPVFEADCLNSLADIARARSNLDLASRRYGQASTLWKRAGSRDYLTADLNRALCEVERGRVDPVEEALPRFRREVDEANLHILRPFVDLFAAWCAVEDRDWDEWEKVVDRATAETRDMEMVERDLARLAECVAVRATEVGAGERAARLLKFGVDQYEAVDDAERAAALRKRLDEVE